MTKNSIGLVMEIAQQMIECGAEIGRVEESVTRICRAYGCEPEVYATPSNVIVSVETENGAQYTQTRRIKSAGIDIERQHLLNDLVRRLSVAPMADEEIVAELKRISATPQYPLWVRLVFYAVISGSFCLFFGSRSWVETILACLIGGVVGLVGAGLDRLYTNRMLNRFLCSLLACGSALLLLRVGVVNSADNIIIGNIMSLIPGIGLTNSLKDLFTGDTVTGILRLMEAVLLAATIALGFWAAFFLTGGAA